MLVICILLEVIKTCLLKSCYHPNSVPFIICDPNAWKHIENPSNISGMYFHVFFWYQDLILLPKYFYPLLCGGFLHIPEASTLFFSHRVLPLYLGPFLNWLSDLIIVVFIEVVPWLENFCIPNMSSHVDYVYSWHTGLYTVTTLWLSKSLFQSELSYLAVLASIFFFQIGSKAPRGQVPGN